MIDSIVAHDRAKQRIEQLAASCEADKECLLAAGRTAQANGQRLYAAALRQALAIIEDERAHA